MTTTSAGATTQAPPHAVSAAQQAMWLHQQLHPDASLYNVYCSVRIDGRLDAGRLERAFAAVVARHESLRTTFPSRGGVPQPRIAPADDAEHAWFRLVEAAELIDVADLPDCLVDEQVARVVQDWCDQPFDLAAGPLLRVTLLRLAADRHLLVLCIHHIVCDGESLTRLFDEVSAVYSAGSEAEAKLPELTAQYSDYVAWRRQQADLDTDLAWWRDYLAGVPDVLDVPADRPRPAVRTADGATIAFDIPADLVQGVAELARQRRMSQFMVLLAGFSALVARTSGADDFVLSVPLTDRPLPEFEPLIGMFVTSLPVRVSVDGRAGFAELLKTVRRSVLAVLTHPGVSIDQLVAAVQPDRSPGHTPLVQVAFSADLALFADPALGELSTEVILPEPTTAKFDLDVSINAHPDGAGYQGILTYSTDLYGERSARRLVERYLRLLRAAVAEPELPVARLPLLADDEREQVLGAWSTGGPGLATGDFAHEMFARQAARRPDAPAVSVAGRVVSYAELADLVERKAGNLRRAGVGPDVVVGVLAERSLDLVSTLLAILRAGGAYLPLSPTHPPAYLGKVLRAAGSRHVVVTRELAHRLAEVDTRPLLSDELGAPGEPAPAPRLHPDNLAYVLFTSGSTGEPKGVAISHRSLAGLVETMRGMYHHTASDRVLQFANATFDITVEELFPTWAAGACVVLSPDPPPDPRGLTKLIAGEGVTFTILTSSIWQNWVTESWRQGLDPAGPLRLISVGAETTDPDTLREWQRRTSVPVWNAYGLTETTVNTTLALLDDAQPENRVSIGRPIAGVDVFVLDDELQPVPPGVAGEIYVGGECLARGYLGRPELTADRFVPHPYSAVPGARLLRTGDAARWLPDGTLQPLGRLDAQLKVRGYRIEPGHIEAVLTSHPGVAAAAIAVRKGPDGQERLVGYIVPADGSVPAGSGSVPADLRDYLGKQLPAYLVPGALVALPAIPRTANGKLDTRALPAPAAPTGTGRTQPANDLERTLAELWQQVLGAGSVSLEENFFDAGGTSLTLARLLARIRTDLGTELSLVSLYEYPSIASLAKHLSAVQGPQEEAAAAAPDAAAASDASDRRRAGRARLAGRRRA